MRTMTSLSPLEASRLVGVNKTTITRSIKDGKLSAAKGDDGRLWIEPAELVRAFPEAAPSITRAPVHLVRHASSSIGASSSDKTLQSDAKSLPSTGAPQEADAISLKPTMADRQKDDIAARLEREAEERQRERRQLEETINDLRSRLDASENERRQQTERLTALLTDQRDKVVSLPVEKHRSWFRRLIG